MASNIYSSSPSPYSNSPIRVPHSRQNTMTSLSQHPGASSPLKTSTAASSIYTLQDTIFDTPIQPQPTMPTPPPRAHHTQTTSSISSIHSFSSKDPIIIPPHHDPSPLHTFAAKLLGSPHHSPQNTKSQQAQQYAAALLSSYQNLQKLKLERKRDDEKRRLRNYTSSFASLPPRPPKRSKLPSWLPLGIANSGLLSLFVVLVLTLSRDPVCMRSGEVVWLVVSVVGMVFGGGWWVVRKACPRARAMRRERDLREVRGGLRGRCSYLDVENGHGSGNGSGEQEMRAFRYGVMRSAGPVDRKRVYSNSDGGGGFVAVRYGSLESLNRVGPVADVGRMRSQTHPFEGPGDWRQELANRQDRPFVKSERGSIFREEFEMGGWKGERGENSLIGVAM